MLHQWNLAFRIRTKNLILMASHRPLILGAWGGSLMFGPALRLHATNASDMEATFTTWFLSGDNDLVCRQSRDLSLNDDFGAWELQIRRLWRDRMHADSPFGIAIVHPKVEPAQNGGHHLIHQQLGRGVRGILLSTHWHGIHTNLRGRLAFVAPVQVQFHDLLRQASLHAECLRQRFLRVGFFCNEPILEQQPLFPRPGAHLEIHLAD